jgi:hypothetical protein
MPRAGVRKPPGEETALGERVAVRRALWGFERVGCGARAGAERSRAKIAIADETICFVSSANLTGHAMEKNMEAGVLIRGGSVPRDLHHHLEALKTSNVIARV